MIIERRYVGERREDGTVHVERLLVKPDGTVHTRSPLPVRLDLVNHSPDGFEWGYCGSGPSQLALAILVDCLGAKEALAHYQQFKFDAVAKLDRDSFELWEHYIRKWHSWQHQETEAAAS